MSEKHESPFFSAVIPVYNQSRWIEETLTSALEQGRKDLEVIVVDDGSTDDSTSIIEKFSGRVNLIRQENAGVAAARNRGFEAARGKWIAFLDSDDLWLPGHLDRLARAIDENPTAGLVYANALVIDEQGKKRKLKPSKPPGPDPFLTVLLANTITTSAAAIRRDVLGEVGNCWPGLQRGEDWDLWLRIAHRHPVVHVPETSVLYRRQTTSLVHTGGAGMREDNLRVIARAAALRPEMPASALRRARANAFQESAIRLLAALETGLARRELWFALKERPSSIRSWALLVASLGGKTLARWIIEQRRARERTS